MVKYLKVNFLDFIDFYSRFKMMDYLSMLLS